MSQTKASGKTLRATMIKKHGTEEAWKEYMGSLGKKGGANGVGSNKGFAANPELARTAGALGGRISKRKPHNV